MNNIAMPYALNKHFTMTFFLLLKASTSIKSINYVQSIILIFVLLFSPSIYASSLPHKLIKVGEGTMSWMLLDIYRASLYTESGLYREGVYPQVLTINYLKNINKQRLIKATEEQWLLQGVDTEKVQGWLKLLRQIWPDINNGDSLTFYVAENREGSFYYNQRLLGNINNDDFSDAFLAIWLSEKTSEPKLRRQLLSL